MVTQYISGDNTATNGTALSVDGEVDIRLFKLLVGLPVSAKNITIYNITNPINASTANIAAKITLPTFSTTNVNPGLYVLDFGPKGLPLNEGGNIIIDATMQVTAVYGKLDDSVE